MTNIYIWWNRPRTVPGRPCRAVARRGSSGELLGVPTLGSVEWYFCFQMWLSMPSAPVIGLDAFPRFMSIDNNGGASSHAPCVVGVSQALRSLRQALACKRVLVRVRERIHDPPPPLITLAAEAHRPRTSILAHACYPRIARRALGVQAGACVCECSRECSRENKNADLCRAGCWRARNHRAMVRAGSVSRG